MGVIDDGGNLVVVGMERLEAAGHRHEPAHVDEDCFHIPAQQHRGAEHCREVVGVEFPGEQHVDFTAVETHDCPVEACLDYASAEIGHCAQRVAFFCGTGVLQHHFAGFVVGIGQCERFGRKSVEKRFFCIKVCLYCFMIVQVVTCQVGKQTSCKCQTCYAVLVGSVRADLHGRVFASAFHHLGKQGVDGERVGCGLGGMHGLCVDIVHNGRQQSGLVAHKPCHFINQGRRGGFAVSAGNPYEAEFFRRFAIPSRGKFAECYRGVLHADICHIGFAVGFGREFFAHDGCHPFTLKCRDKRVPVDGDPSYGHEHAPLSGLARIGGQG